MKLRLILFYLAIISFNQSLLQAQAGKTIQLINKNSFARPEELIILQRADLEKKLGPIKKFVQLTIKGKPVVCQHDDLSGDGLWDEVVFLYSFQANEKVDCVVAGCDQVSNSESQQRAHVRLRKRMPDNSWGENINREQMPFRNPATDFNKQPLPDYLTEGPAWENDKVGFRLYFDVRNAKDIWGKCTNRMVLDSVGTKVQPSYHELGDWGMDILKVGKSLGAGGIGLLITNRNKDSLIRLAGDNILNTVYEKIADGPVRAIFRMHYQAVIEAEKVTIIEQTSIWSGQYFYESKVSIKGAPDDLQFVVGIPNLYPNNFQCFQKSKVAAMLSHGVQSENKDHLGMAILMQDTGSPVFGATSSEGADILDTYYAAQPISSSHDLVYRFYACWQKTDQLFAQFGAFKDFIEKETRKISNKIIVTY